MGDGLCAGGTGTGARPELGERPAALYQVLLGKTCFHLWFLYMLLGLYLVTPVLRAFVRGAGRGDFHWFFLLVFVFTFLLPTLLRLRPSQTVSLYRAT